MSNFDKATIKDFIVFCREQTAGCDSGSCYCDCPGYLNCSYGSECMFDRMVDYLETIKEKG